MIAVSNLQTKSINSLAQTQEKRIEIKEMIELVSESFREKKEAQAGVHVWKLESIVESV